MALQRCPKCQAVMVERTVKRGPKAGRKFLGCSNFPRCNETVWPKYQKQERPASVERRAITPTSEQAAIFGAMAATDNHLLVRARAGTGKSTTLREGAYHLPQGKSVLYVAFNRSIVDEMAGTMPASVDVLSFNQVGMRDCCKAYGKPSVARYKTRDLLETLWKPNKGEEDMARVVAALCQDLVGKARCYLSDGGAESLEEIIARHDIEMAPALKPLIFDLVPKLLAAHAATTSIIDFDDQLWLPVRNRLAPSKRYDVVMIDEAQDLEPLKHAFILRYLADGGRVIIVGDDRQAINGWKGADTASMNTLCAMVEAATPKRVLEFPLTISQRCPKAVIREAQKYVHDIRARDDAPEGAILETDTRKAVELYRAGDMVLCRMNAPLISVAFGIIARGTKAVIRGRDIASKLASLVDKFHAGSVGDLLVKLEQWQAEECAKWEGSRYAEERTASIIDNADCIRALAEGVETIDGIRKRIDEVFADFDKDGAPRGAVVLSSIHKAKGLEANRIFWLRPDLSAKASQEWQAEQEENLAYVATTRVKFLAESEGELYYVRKARGAAA